jgi:hypothetical protein
MFTPAECDAFPGTPFPAPAGTYPTKDQVADYLNADAQQHRLPVRAEHRGHPTAQQQRRLQITDELAATHQVTVDAEFHRTLGASSRRGGLRRLRLEPAGARKRCRLSSSVQLAPDGLLSAPLTFRSSRLASFSWPLPIATMSSPNGMMSAG